MGEYDHIEYIARKMKSYDENNSHKTWRELAYAAYTAYIEYEIEHSERSQRV